MSSELNKFIFDCYRSLVLGIVQGITEFFPISSTAHLKVVPLLLGWSDPGVSISASLQLGSVFAIILYFKKDLISISRSFLSIFNHKKLYNNKDTTLASFILLANIPILFSGLFIKLYWISYSDSYLRGLLSIAIVSIIASLFLFLSDLFGKRNKKIKDINIFEILFIGISQAFALIPGVSRSGITFSAALFSGLNRQDAARFSFLIGIPAISISGIYEMFSLFSFSTYQEIIPILFGIFSSFLSSLFVIDFFLKYLKHNNSFVFVLYRLAFASFILSTLYL